MPQPPSQHPLTLPLVGQITEEDHGAVFTYLTLLAQEAQDARAEWLALADENTEVYTYGCPRADYDDAKILVNEIQNAIIAATDTQMKDPPTASLDPVETGDPGQTYWAGPPEYGAALGLPPEFLVPGMDATTQLPLPPMPVDEMTAEFLKQSVQAQAIPDKWVVTVDDKLITDVYQSVFDVFWKRSETDRFIRQNLLTTNVQGWAWGLYEYDYERQRHVLRNISIRQVYIDPTVEALEDAAYAGMDVVYDADEAKALYPHISDLIDKNAKRGEPQRPDGSWSFGKAFERDFQRPMVTMRIFWLRNQIQPQTPEELGAVAAPPPQQLDAEAAAAMNIPTEAQPPQFQLPDGTVKTPGGPDWPVRRVLRQITCIESITVDDKPVEHVDIPLLHNVNIPVIGKPWGIGEPFRLKGLQRARSQMLDAIVQHVDFYRAPVMALPQSVHDSIPDEQKDMGIVPNMMLVFPDDLYLSMGGKMFSVVDPPTTPPALIEAQALLHAEISEQSGHTEVMRGQMPAGGETSGRAIGMLQEAGSSQMSFKAQRTQLMVERLSKLMLFSLVHRLTVEDVGRIVSKYPPHILAAIHERAGSMEWDVKVTVAAGAGSVAIAKKQEALQLFMNRDPATGEPLAGIEHAREVFGIDHQQERQRWMSDMADMAGQQPQQGGEGEEGGGEEGGGGEDKGGPPSGE